MPAPARVSVVVKPTTQLNGAEINSKPIAHRPKGRLVPRRRGRGRADETDSEEELVREPRSDSESETATSTVESETASEFNSETEEETQSAPPESVSPSTRPRATPTTTTTPEDGPAGSSFFPGRESWSDIMANHPTESLPTMEFSELNLQDSVAATQQQQQRSAVPSPPPSDHEQGSKLESDAQSSTREGKGSRFSRKPGQSAREAYINRLNNDPAYVPTVGQFWSHDDRLLDKDLRSLSTWWRGKWQGRGRGVRGRGGFTNGWSARGRAAFRNTGNRFEEADASQPETAWSHDKFEEVKEAGYKERGNITRGGRGFKTRNFSRKETDRTQIPDVSSQMPRSSQSASDTLLFGDGQRPWFAMKPERLWTKQFDAYLHFDAQLKPLQTQGLGQGVRVKLPNPNTSSADHEPVIIRLPLDTSHLSKQSQASSSDSDLPQLFAVKLPSLKSIGKQKEVVKENITTISPLHVNDRLPSTSVAAASVSQESSSSRTILESSQHPIIETNVMLNQPSVPITQGNGVLLAPKEEPIIPVTSQPPQSSSVPSLPVLSPFQPSSPYATPYVYTGHGVPFPPGIAIAENGVTYEIATGRAVYLQTPPPPPPHISLQSPVYNPQPMAIPHGHHNGMSFINSMPLSVSPSGFLPTPPLFALPRQSSRIEIRAPDDSKNSTREPQRSTSQDRLSNSKSADTFTPNAQAAGSYYSEGQPLYTPSYYYPYAPDGAASFGYGQYSNVDSTQTYDHYNHAHDPYSQHSAYY